MNALLLRGQSRGHSSNPLSDICGEEQRCTGTEKKPFKYHLKVTEIFVASISFYRILQCLCNALSLSRSTRGYLRSCTLSPSFSSRNLMSSVMSSSSYFCCSRFSSCFSTLHWIMARAYSCRVSFSPDFSRRFCQKQQQQREGQTLHIYFFSPVRSEQLDRIWKKTSNNSHATRSMSKSLYYSSSRNNQYSWLIYYIWSIIWI